MKVSYDREVDILYIKLTDAPIEESDEEKPGFVIDYDANGSVVGIEIMNASKSVTKPNSVELAIAWSSLFKCSRAGASYGPGFFFATNS